MFVLKCGSVAINNFVRFWYESPLNGIRMFEIAVDGAGTTQRTELDTTKTVEIYRNNSLDFKGEVDSVDSFQGGGLILRGFGQELDFAEVPCPIDAGKTTKVWTSTGANTIFAALVAEASGWSSDVTNSTDDSLDSFKVSESMTAWEGILSLLKHTGKDIGVNDSTKTLFLYDAKGSSAVAVFNEGIDCGQIRYKKRKPSAAKVIVYGKGDGANQITGSSGSGTPVKRVVDLNIITTTEANNRAAKELALIQSDVKNYSFKSFNATKTIVTGDQVKLNAHSVGLHNQDIDVVRVKRGIEGPTEFLELEVTNTAYRIASRSLQEEKIISQSKNDVGNSTMQGSGNTLIWGKGINIKSGSPLSLTFFLPEDIIKDEAGNMRVNSMTVDYDLDPYNQQFGTASFNGSDPQVQNSSASTQPDVSGSSSNTQPDVSGSSGDAAPAVEDSSGYAWSGTSVGSDTDTGKSLTAGAWRVVSSVPTTNSGRGIYANFFIKGNSGGPEDIHVKVKNSGVSTSTDSEWGVYQDGFRNNSHVKAQGVSVGPNGYNDAIYLEVYPEGNIVVDGYLSVYESSHVHPAGTYNAVSHPHTDGSYIAANHPHADGTYIAANHPHADGTYDINAADIDNISIGDGVGEAGSVNASEVDIYLDFWNGSAWVNKHSVLNTGKTIDQGVDITDSGTYPDNHGFWRIRIDSDNAAADFAQGIIRIKHNLDS